MNKINEGSIYLNRKIDESKPVKATRIKTTRRIMSVPQLINLRGVISQDKWDELNIEQPSVANKPRVDGPEYHEALYKNNRDNDNTLKWMLNIVDKDIPVSKIKYSGAIYTKILEIVKRHLPAESRGWSWAPSTEDTENADPGVKPAIVDITTYLKTLIERDDDRALTKYFNKLHEEFRYSNIFQTYWNQVDHMQPEVTTSTRPWYDTTGNLATKDAWNWFEDLEVVRTEQVMQYFFYVFKKYILPELSDKYSLTSDSYILFKMQAIDPDDYTPYIGFKPNLSIISDNDETIKYFIKNNLVKIRFKNILKFLPYNYDENGRDPDGGYNGNLRLIKYYSNPEIYFEFESLAGVKSSIRILDIKVNPLDVIHTAMFRDGNKIKTVSFDASKQRLTWTGGKYSEGANIMMAPFNLIIMGEHEQPEEILTTASDSVTLPPPGDAAVGGTVDHFLKLVFKKSGYTVTNAIATPWFQFGSYTGTVGPLNLDGAVEKLTKVNVGFINLTALSSDGQFIFSVPLLPKTTPDYFEAVTDIDNLKSIDAVYVLGNKI